MGRSLEGSVFEPHCPTSLREALSQAVDYRGDVTLHLDDGSEITGFVYHADFSQPEAVIDYFPAVDNSPRSRLEAARIRRIVFSGRDTADGKSWEAWLERQGKSKRP